LKYLFVEVPNTGCTAIRLTLMKQYGGRPILHKHATYYEFRRAFPGWRDYYVFGGVRSPLDTTLTQYRKMVYNHKGRFGPDAKRHWWSATRRHRRQFESVQAGMTFPEYLLRFHRAQYHNFYLSGHRHFGGVMRHERFSEDWRRILGEIGVPANEIRDVPVVNATEGKGHISDAYTRDVRGHAMRVFGPFMAEWNYPFPEDWAPEPTTAWQSSRYRLVEKVADMAGEHLGLSPNGSPAIVQALRNAVRPFIG
jgi:hypothetical protein